MFPADEEAKNLALCVTGKGSKKPFSVLMVHQLPDLELISKGQCFPRYRFEKPPAVQDELPGIETDRERVDNISDTALRAFRVSYSDSGITKDDIFHYIYGILHAPQYRERFSNDLSKALPRIPFALNFHDFASAGRDLAALHLGYETCEQYPLATVFSGEGEMGIEHFRIGTKPMHFADQDRSILALNDLVRLEGVPAEAHAYQVNGRTPLEWFIDRYRVVTDSRSGILNDPNGWFDDPWDLIAAFRRIVYVSVETARIVKALPEPFDDSRPGDADAAA